MNKTELDYLIKEYKDDIKTVKYRAKLRYLNNRIASDGKRYDEDNLNRDIYDNEVEIIQFLRPNGRRRLMTCGVPSDIKEMAKDMILSAEELTTGEIAIYARYKDDKEENERIVLATNDNNPDTNSTVKLIEVIKRCKNVKIYDKKPKDKAVN